MKKIISILMVITVLFAFSACSNNAENESETQNTASQPQITSDTATESESKDKTAVSSKILVVYFSASGNTENVANYIAKAVNGDVFELEPKDVYSDADLNWTNPDSRVNYEHENESARNIELVSSTVDNWDDYDTVFIGYPIWWQLAAWPVNHFVKNNDFTGKTVIPFCTSTSSGIGESGKRLEEMAGTGNWLEGKRFSESVFENDVTDWVNSLDL